MKFKRVDNAERIGFIEINRKEALELITELARQLTEQTDENKNLQLDIFND